MQPISSFLSLLPLTLCLSLLLPRPIVATTSISSTITTTTANATAAAAAAKGTNLIGKACELSSHKEFCIGSLESYPDSKESDMTGLAFIALKIAAASATNTTIKIKELLREPNLDPFAEQCLADCEEHYLDAIEQIDDSLAALAANAYKDIDTWVKAAIADTESCEASFKEQAGHPLLLTHANKSLRQLCNNALIIARLLEKH